MAKKRKLTNNSGATPVNVEPEVKQEIKDEQLEEEQQVEQEMEEPEPEQQDEQQQQQQGEQQQQEENRTTETAPENPSNEDEDNNNEDNDDEDDSDEEPVTKLIDPFSKEQLIDLLREAAENHPDVLDNIRKISETDPVHRKIFVHGLGWDTNAEILTNVFKEYGEIEDCNAVSDKISGKSKGYAFILFKTRSGARKALKEPQKKIGTRMTACQLASAGPVPPPAPAAPPSSEYTQRKIYVSNVSADIDPQKLSSFFAKFGEIEEGPLGLDKQTGKPKGFALFVYKTVESARKALEEPHKPFDGHVLHVQKAIDGPKPNKSFHHQYPQGGHGTGGRAGGGGSQFARNPAANSSYMGNAGGTGGSGAHLMGQSPAPAIGFNQGASPALNPVIGQAISALLASQGGAGLGLTNLLGSLGSAAGVNQNVQQMHGGYGNPVGGQGVMGGGYVNQGGMQGGYPNSQMGQGSGGRSQQGGGHLGGVNPYMGH